jgi:hypothetical protein
VKDKNLKNDLLHLGADGLKVAQGLQSGLFKERQNKQFSVQMVNAITPGEETDKWTTDEQDQQAMVAIEERERLSKLRQQLGFFGREGTGEAPACPQEPAADNGAATPDAGPTAAGGHALGEEGEVEEEAGGEVEAGEGMLPQQQQRWFQRLLSLPRRPPLLHRLLESTNGNSSSPLLLSSAEPWQTTCNDQFLLARSPSGFCIWSDGNVVRTASPSGTFVSVDWEGAGWSCSGINGLDPQRSGFLPAFFFFQQT